MDKVHEARLRFDDAKEQWSENFTQMLEALKFSNPANPEQWPQALRNSRENSPTGSRPCLTLDQTDQYVRQMVNSARQNKPSIKYHPVDDKADKQVAEMLQGMARNIEYTSRADIAYDMAVELAGKAGLGWIRVMTEVINDATNEQEIRIKRVKDPFSVMLVDWEEPDGSDALEGFVEGWLSRPQFERQYPKHDTVSWQSSGYGDWFQEDKIRICEHYAIEEIKSNCIVALELSTGEENEYSEDEFHQARAKGAQLLVKHTYFKTKRKQTWNKMSGADVLETTTFASDYIPLVPVIGSESWIESKRYLCGLVRPAMDAQRIYNYERSNFVEFVSLRNKVPYIGPAEAFQGHEEYWKSANNTNYPYLPYNHEDRTGNSIPAPNRQMAPDVPPGYMQGIEVAKQDLQAAFGMYQGSLGNNPNEQSGVALRAVQSRGDLANFHIVDNFRRSLTQVGKIVLQLIPAVMDTKRIARIIGEDGAHDFVQIDPSLAVAANKRGNKVLAINPAVGRYDVTVSTGPAYLTKRQEQAASLQEIMARNPHAIPLVGDLWAKSLDIPESEKIAERMRAMLPPEIRQMEDKNAEFPPEAMQQINMLIQKLQSMQQEVQAMHQEGSEVIGKLQEENMQLKAENQSVKISSEMTKLDAKKQVMTMVESRMQDAQQPAQLAETTEPQEAQGTAKLIEIVSQLVMRRDESEAEDQAEENQMLASLNQVMQQVAQMAQVIAAPKVKTARLPDGRMIEMTEQPIVN